MLISLDPKTSALVVVDMQNDFCAEAGYYARAGADISNFAAVDGPVAGMIDRARRSNVPIVFTRLVYGPERGAMEDRHRIKPRRWSSTGERLKPGSWGADIIDSIAPRPEDLIVDKAGYSAFEDTALEAELRSRGIKTIVLVGLVTYACVLATAFSAFDRDFDVVMATDAVASWSDNLQKEASDIVDLLLGAAVTMDEITFEG